MNWYCHLGKKRKSEKKREKSEKGPEWVGEEEEDWFPGISHITSVAMAITLSVFTCSEQQLHLELHSQAISIVLIWERGGWKSGMLSPKKVMRWCDRERRRVCKHALTWSLLLPGFHLGHACIWHPAQPPPELLLELLGWAMVDISKKGLGRGSENSAITASSIWRNYKTCLDSKHLFYALSNQQNGRKCWITDTVLGKTPSHPQIAYNANRNMAQTRICGKSDSLEMTYLYSTSQHHIMAALLMQGLILEVLPHSGPWGRTQPSSSA